MWCWAGRQKASTLPSYMPAWKFVWPSLLLRAWLQSLGHSHPACFFIPGSKGQLAHEQTGLLLRLWHPSTDHQILPTTSLLEKVKGSGFCCLGRERKRWRKHWSDLQAGFNPCQKVWSMENMSQHITKTEHIVISSSKLKQNSPPSQKDFVWDSPDLTKRALVRHTPYTVKISRLLMLFKYDQNRSILQVLSPKLPSLFTYNSDIPSGI